MPKGKQWTVEEEKKLREMIAAGCNAHEIAVELKREPNAVYEKAKRLGLKVIISRKSRKIITSNLRLPEDLPSVEDQLKVLAGALDALQEQGLEQADVLRLRSIIQGVKTYKELFVDFVNYRALEEKVEELIRELERDRERASGVARKRSEN